MMHEGAYAWVWPWKYTARVRSIHDEQLYIKILRLHPYPYIHLQENLKAFENTLHTENQEKRKRKENEAGKY